MTLGFLFLPGMRDVERSGDLARASAEDDELPLGFLADDPMVPHRRGGDPPAGIRSRRDRLLSSGDEPTGAVLENPIPNG